MTQIEMPFLQRMFSATRKSAEPRLLAAWDMERIDIEELSTSDFEQGADLARTTTLLRDGHHWANLTRDVFPEYRAGFTKELSAALLNTAQSIDATRFFRGGKISLPQSSILLKPPKDRYIVRTEREVNVTRLRAWADQNLLSVEGEIFIRVREPALFLDFAGPYLNDQCMMSFNVAGLVPFHRRESCGVLATISEKDDIRCLAEELLRTDRRVISLDELEDDVFERLTCPTDDVKEVLSRSLVSVAKRFDYNTPNAPAQLTKAVKQWLAIEENQDDEEKLTELSDLLADHVCMIRFPLSTAVKMAVDRWNDRPITNVHAHGMRP